MSWAVLGALRHGLLQCCLTLQTWLSSSCLLCVLVALSCPTLCDPMGCSLSGSSFRGILQARILEWVAMPSSKGFSWLGHQTLDSCTAGRLFTTWATREVLLPISDFLSDLKSAALSYRWTFYDPYAETVGTKPLFFFPYFLIFGLLTRVIVCRFLPHPPLPQGVTGAQAFLLQPAKGVERYHSQPSPSPPQNSLKQDWTALRSSLHSEFS